MLGAVQECEKTQVHNPMGDGHRSGCCCVVYALLVGCWRGRAVGVVPSVLETAGKRIQFSTCSDVVLVVVVLLSLVGVGI